MSVIIHLGGEIPSAALACRLAGPADLLIAADSGYDSCLKNGLKPHFVTGDFDSISAAPDSSEITVIPATEQDATDFEKALRLVPGNTRNLEILGGTGLRSDHFLTNLLIAAGQPPDMSIVFHDDLQSIYRVTNACPFDEQVTPGTIVSLIPFCEPEGVTTSGLMWDLSDSRMGPCHQLGQSNQAAVPAVRISISNGCVYVVVNRLQAH